MSRAPLAVLVVLLLGLRVQAEESLAGTWEAKMEGYTIVLDLKPDGTGTMEEEKITWRVQDGKLEIAVEDETIVYSFKRDGASLSISGGDLDEPMTFTKKGGEKKGLGGKKKGLAGKLGVEEGGQAKPPVEQPRPAEGGIVGEWEATGPDGVVVMALKADGTGSIGAQAFKYMFTEKTLTLSAGGEQIEYGYGLKGDVLVLSGGDLPQPTEFKRKGAAGPAPAPEPEKGLVGTWRTEGETFEIRADGTIAVNGQTVQYEVKGTTLTFVGPNGRVPFEFTLEGDTLKLTSEGTTSTYKRVGAAGEGTPGGGGAAEGVAGVWMVMEASLDPTNYMSYTQYVTLLPDGSVAYQKAEGGASRDAVSEHLERFRSWRNDGSTVGEAGNWESDGRTIRIQWRLWNGLVSEGQVDLASGKLTLSGMGVLEEGATLTFERQQ